MLFDMMTASNQPNSGSNSPTGCDLGGGGWDRLTIVGVGLLGASLGLAAKARGLLRPGGVVRGVGRGGSTALATAQSRGAIDETFTDLAAAVRRGPQEQNQHDLIILCTPVRQFPELLRILAQAAPTGALITDVGSTKVQIMQWARDILGSGQTAHGRTFIGSHPMAGSEKHGPAAARADLYENALCLLTPPLDSTPTTDPAVARLTVFWQALGMRTLSLDAATHDQWVALVSHLPHAVAGCLMTAAGQRAEVLVAAAGGFVDSTRIAAGDPQMWTDIFLTNQAAVLAALDTFSGELAEFRRAIAQGDEKAIRAHLEQAQKERLAFGEKMKPPRRHDAKGHG